MLHGCGERTPITRGKGTGVGLGKGHLPFRPPTLPATPLRLAPTTPALEFPSCALPPCHSWRPGVPGAGRGFHFPAPEGAAAGARRLEPGPSGGGSRAWGCRGTRGTRRGAAPSPLPRASLTRTSSPPRDKLPRCRTPAFPGPYSPGSPQLPGSELGPPRGEGSKPGAPGASVEFARPPAPSAWSALPAARRGQAGNVALP